MRNLNHLMYGVKLGPILIFLSQRSKCTITYEIHVTIFQIHVITCEIYVTTCYSSHAVEFL